MQKGELTPGYLMEISGGYWKTCALHAAVKLDVFTIIGDAKIPGESVALEANADARATTMLLNALVAMDLLVKTDNQFANTEIARDFLSKDSPKYLGHIIGHHHQLMGSWTRLDEGIRTGRPVRSRASRTDDSWRENFLMGMFNMDGKAAKYYFRQKYLENEEKEE